MRRSALFLTLMVVAFVVFIFRVRASREEAQPANDQAVSSTR